MKQVPLPVSGYVLAGGRSSRMGIDKALMLFQGEPLIQRAVDKLRLICKEVSILGDRPELAAFGEAVSDRLPGRGPLGGIETALRHASSEWIMVLPVDVPLVPESLLMEWAWRTIGDERERPAACCFRVEGRVQPLVSLLRRELAPYVTEALDGGERKVMFVLEDAAAKAARQGKGLLRSGLRVDDLEGDLWGEIWSPTALQLATKHLWFANVNTPDEFKRVEETLVDAEADEFRGRMHLK